MQDVGNELQKAFWRADSHNEEPMFDQLWPTESRGDGKVRRNNVHTGSAQGKSNLVRKAPCQLCGFPNDLTAVDHSGGSLDGEGAGGAITSTLVSAPVTGGGVHTEYVGTQALRLNSGCALCFSKNNTKLRQDIMVNTDPWSRLRPLGFIFILGFFFVK